MREIRATHEAHSAIDYRQRKIRTTLLFRLLPVATSPEMAALCKMFARESLAKAPARGGGAARTRGRATFEFYRDAEGRSSPLGVASYVVTPRYGIRRSGGRCVWCLRWVHLFSCALPAVAVVEGRRCCIRDSRKTPRRPASLLYPRRVVPARHRSLRVLSRTIFAPAVLFLRVVLALSRHHFRHCLSSPWLLTALRLSRLFLSYSRSSFLVLALRRTCAVVSRLFDERHRLLVITVAATVNVNAASYYVHAERVMAKSREDVASQAEQPQAAET